MKAYAIGIDVGGTTVKLGLFRNSGELVRKWEIATDTGAGGKNILPDIAVSLKDMLHKKSVAFEDIEGAGIGVPGAVTSSSVVNGCANLGWGVVDVSGTLSGLLGGLTVKAVNDANAAALGEMWQGGAAGFRNLVMVTLGTGVGGSIIVDGRVLEGAFGAAGEIGHICLNTDETAVCGCGKKGHLEQYASANGISRLARLALKETDEPSSLRQLEDPTSKDIFDAAKAGDGFALGQLEAFGSCLGRALAMISCVVDPEIFLIGGGVSRAGSILTDTVRKYYREYAFHNSEATPIELAKLGSDAGIYGAAKMVL